MRISGEVGWVEGRVDKLGYVQGINIMQVRGGARVRKRLEVEMCSRWKVMPL